MAGMSYYAAEKTLNTWFRKAALTPPATLYFALYEVAPTAAGEGTEVRGGGYGRVPLGNVTAAEVIGGKMAVRNAETVRMPKATAEWTRAAHFGILDAQTGGSLIAWGPLRIPKTCEAEDYLEFDPNSLIVSLE